MKKAEIKHKFKNNYHFKLFKACLFLFSPLLGIIQAQASINQEKALVFSINIKDKTVVQAIEEIEKKTGYLFFYYEGFVDSKKTIDLKEENQTLSKILDKLFYKSENTYSIDGRQVFIKKVKAITTISKNDRIIVRGKIVDETGESLPGASIVVQGANTFGVTDNEGNFSMAVEGENAVLSVSYVGYITKSVMINEARLIRMQTSVRSLANIVVTGIFNRKEEGYTGSTVSISGKELQRVGNQNVIQSIKNLDPSLYIPVNLSSGSDPNALPEMQLRGVSTFTEEQTSGLKGYYQGKPNTPLIILDRFETTLERIIDMDMNRIESITILKDASAKAIYGSKAANGVIVIETKTMNSEKPRVTYLGSVSFEMPDLTSYNLCNSVEKLNVEKIEGYYDNGITTDQIISNQQIYNKRLKSALEGESTYWLSKPLRTGIGNKHSISVELGEKDLKAIADFSYNNVQGVMKGSDFTSISGAMNVSYRKKNILFRNIMEIMGKESNDSPYGSFNTYAKMNPYWNPFNSDGSLKKTLDVNNGLNNDIANPMYDATLNVLLRNTYQNFIDNFYVEVDFLKDFKVRASAGIATQRFDDEEFYPSAHSKFSGYAYFGDEEKALQKGSYDLTNGKTSTLSGKFDLQYDKKLGKHNIFFDFSYELSEKKYNQTGIKTVGFPSGSVSNISFARQYAEGTTPSSYDAINREMGFLEYLSYNYDNRYITDLTFRTNGASVFGNNNPWANFWSVGLGWNIHNESFLKDVKGLEVLKLRGSYGTSGNQNFAQNTSYATYNYNTTGQYLGFFGIYLNNMENPGLMWESKEEANFGLDLNYSGLSIKLDYYDAITSNMVTNLSIVPSTGFNVVRENLGKISNKGFEASLGYTLLRNKDGYLNFTGKIATNENKILQISEALRSFNKSQTEIATRGDQSLPVLEYVDGMPMHAIWAVKSLGIDPVTGYEVFLNQKGEKTYTWNASDRIYCGTSDPKFNGIFGFNGEYKGFGISATATFLGGGNAYNQTLVDNVENVDIAYNVDRRVLSGRWQTPGQNAQYTILTRYWTNPETGQQERVVTNATSRFVQRRNDLTLSSIAAYYDFSREFTKKLNFQQLRLSFYINDVYTWSTIRIERGTSYPFARNMSFSLTATF